ncbi:hypothetical protein NEOLEDRAFT_1157320 [Neolentinus lepideus HHB14362 ss-1]|uniref:Acyl-CoA dehydrogenase NM domain-like protein n=1 Tax=Neolentinus lepideus HHB14362 ss-1 TaxID=1314782 RepID=A0A165R836_9AGAM|nr:hypothetical protein NEOLEDRAFT_1157320 [Neolentinus lepideus HHB14362 ss-1]
MRAEEGFQQTPYTEGNPYAADPALPSLLRRLFPRSILEEIEPDLRRFGDEILTTVRSIRERAASPQLTQYDHWGRRVDELHLSEGWRELIALSQREGIIGIFYERQYGELSRVYGFTKMLMATGDTQTVFCPLSMTDGCARVIELQGTSAMKAEIYPRLISRDPSKAFVSGQWMTERSGGSDVSRTETVATPEPRSSNPESRLGTPYRLDGFKWFSSATDSDVALALARTGPPEQGTKSLSLFLVPLRLPLLSDFSKPSDLPKPSTRSALSNSILIHRLKNKIGTHILPTAELSLQHAGGYLIGSLNGGVKAIAPVLNITRVHSALSSVGYLRKSLSIAISYSKVRAIHSGTQLLCDNEMHIAELAGISLVYRAVVHLVFGVIKLLGKSECGTASDEEEKRLRLLTPVVKAFAAEMACRAMPECMAALGGQGYMEETGIGRCIRDGLVEKIWEGTTSVLSLDLQRATVSDPNLNVFIQWANSILSSCPGAMATEAVALRSAVEELQATYTPPISPLVTRPALFLFGYVASALYLLEHAVWSSATSQPERETDVEVFKRWVAEGGLQSSVGAVRTARAVAQGNRSKMNRAIVYWSTSTTAKL